jgi:glycosyltransferase involved in cell wall biosynthesis
VRLGIHPADRIVVFHGPPDRAHGVETAIRALRVLGDRVVLAILGATWCQDRLLRVAAEAGVLAQVRVLSPGPEDDVVRLVASAEAAVLPLSPSDRVARLGLPSALLECLLAGTPVVVTDVLESGALVRRIAAGIVVPAPRGERSEPHPNDVAEGVRALLSDARLRAACGANAARAVREDLHWERESRRLADLYERLAAQG